MRDRAAGRLAARRRRGRALAWCGTLARLALGAGGLVRPASAAAQAPADSTRRTLQAVRSTTPLSIDGRLDEPVWATAPLADGFTQVEPRQEVPSAFTTTVRVVDDGTQLVFGFVVKDSLGARGIRVQDLRRKFDFFQNDLVGVSLDPFLDRRNAIAFQVTPYGAQRELQVYDGTTYNREWEAVWRVRTEVTDSGWTAEVAVPWATLRYPAGATTFGVNFHRVARRANEQSGWVPWPRNLNPYRMDFAGELRGLAPPPPSSNLRARPYLVTDVARTSTAGVGSTDVSPSVGGELIWSPTPNTVVDATFRTDFAQADVDRQVVNLRRFSVFFPERRQFFLENRSLFDVGLEDGFYNLQPFFSRTIGLSEAGEPIPIQAGLRVNRRSAQSAFGGLLIRQDGSEGRGPATIGAARWSRNLGGVTRVGGLVTGRFDAAGATLGARSGGTAAVDLFGRFGPSTEYNAMVSVTTGGDSGRTGVAYNAFIGRQTDRLYTGFLSTLVSADYRPATGFVSRPNILLLSPAILGDVRPSWKPAAIRRFTPALLGYLFLDPQSLQLQEGFVEWYVDVDFQDGTLFYPLVQRQFQRPTAPFSFVDGVTIPAGELDYWRVGGTFRSDASRPVSVRVDATTGGFFGGELDQGTLSLRVVPSPKVALTAGYEVNRFRRLGVERRTFTTHLLQPELRVALSPRLQATAFYQYNSEIRRGALNARLSWEFAPLSYLFVVWNDRRLAGSRRPGEPPVPTTQQLILKGVWLRQF